MTTVMVLGGYFVLASIVEMRALQRHFQEEERLDLVPSLGIADSGSLRGVSQAGRKFGVRAAFESYALRRRYEPGRRDWWSIVDILAKVAASVLLAVLGFVISSRRASDRPRPPGVLGGLRSSLAPPVG